MQLKKHFKMYKAGKVWLFMAVSVAFSVSNVSDAHADATTNNSQINSESIVQQKTTTPNLESKNLNPTNNVTSNTIDQTTNNQNSESTGQATNTPKENTNDLTTTSGQDNQAPSTDSDNSNDSKTTAKTNGLPMAASPNESINAQTTTSLEENTSNSLTDGYNQFTTDVQSYNDALSAYNLSLNSYKQKYDTYIQGSGDFNDLLSNYQSISSQYEALKSGFTSLMTRYNQLLQSTPIYVDQDKRIQNAITQATNIRNSENASPELVASLVQYRYYKLLSEYTNFTSQSQLGLANSPKAPNLVFNLQTNETSVISPDFAKFNLNNLNLDVLNFLIQNKQISANTLGSYIPTQSEINTYISYLASATALPDYQGFLAIINGQLSVVSSQIDNLNQSFSDGDIPSSQQALMNKYLALWLKDQTLLTAESNGTDQDSYDRFVQQLTSIDAQKN